MTVSSLFDMTGSFKSSFSFLSALPYVETARRISSARPGYCPTVAIATAAVARCNTDDGLALVCSGTKYSRKPLVDSACCGKAIKFLKKNGTASYSGGICIVVGNAFSKFHMKLSKSNV